MKITEIRVDRCGVWRDLTLPTFSSGLNVIYGPNETGKSTLMRFIRGVLYGFGPTGPRIHAGGQPPGDCKGSLRIAHHGEEFDVHRFAREGERGAVRVYGYDDQRAESAVTRLLSQTPEEIFERLFAVDLLELQELATLSGDELADKVYGLTLGPEGRTILDSWTELAGRQNRLFDVSDKSGRLPHLLQRRADLTEEIEAAEARRERHTVLSHERDELQEEIERRKSQQVHWNSQLRGHQFLEQAWPAWNRVQEIHRELGTLPSVADFPDDGLERLDQIETDIRTHARNRKRLTAEARSLRDQLKQQRATETFWPHAASIEAVYSRRKRLKQLLADFDKLQARAAAAAQEKTEAAEPLGDEWTAKRLASADTSPTAQMRLLDAARGYHGRLDRRSRVRRLYKRRAAACSQQTRTLQEELKTFGDGTIAEHIDATKQRLSYLEEVDRLRMRETQLEHQRVNLSERLTRIEQHPPLPPWAYLVLAVFGVLGLIFGLVGFYTGMTTNGLIGLMYALLGITCGGTAYALKTHAETTAGDNVERMADELRTLETELRGVREDIELLLDDAFPEASADADVNELLQQQTRQLVELERLQSTEQRIAVRRQRLSQYRGKLQQVQRDVITSRQIWCEVLDQIGLKETLRVDEAFDEWQHVVSAREAQLNWEQADRERTVCVQSLGEIIEAVGEVGEKLESNYSGVDDLVVLIDGWKSGLENEQRLRNQRRQQLREAKAKLREAASHRRQAGKCRSRRTALLTQVGAANRDEFAERAASIIRRKELESALFSASAELESICRTEPELAIVEEDMIEFNMEDNTAQLTMLEAALVQSEGDVQSLFERLGRVKQEIADLEADGRGTRLRFNRARVEDELTEATEEWFSLQLASRALADTQRQFERDYQPATLAAATKYLTQMTQGRYRNIWVPLGKQALCVDDERGNSYRVEQLSSGTREQLFLAIRLAIVAELSQEGVELPMILDDVFANFDESRTEAAVETLQEFAAEGQQILLMTCHVHLARMLDAQGVNAIWLPNSHATIEERRAG